VVPKANNSAEYISEHNHVKQGDIVLKYALTCAVRGAILANKNSSIKLFYRKILKKGVDNSEKQSQPNTSTLFRDSVILYDGGFNRNTPGILVALLSQSWACKSAVIIIAIMCI
jgi:hypothetical protein